MVQDSTELKDKDGNYILELKHNKNKDPYNYEHWGIASFDITSLQESGKDSIGISLRSLNSDGELKYTKDFIYDYSEDAKNDIRKFTKSDEELLIK